MTDEQQAALAANGKSIRRGNPGNLKNAEAGRMNGWAVRAKIANSCTSDPLPIIEELKGSGAVSLQQIAAGLNAKRIKTAQGGEWSAVQMQRVMECAT
ncbi:recombinase family protein [Microvirga yunnanensis]|uniref:recombinase family protein n=1 Tax=Microvirga yunnanensis TaxID=2953740 RepID=UPI0021C789B4|nr:recombinase family protein [Microvirga sp. HBU65207]